MNGASGKSSPCVSSDGQESLDALEVLYKQEASVESCANDVEPSGIIEQKAISGIDVALSEDCGDADKQTVSSECFDTASESNGIQSDVIEGNGSQTSLLASDLDAIQDGGFDDIVAMEAEGDSQFEQTMAMLRDLSGSEVSPAIVSCVDDLPTQLENAANTEMNLSSNTTETSNYCNKNDVRQDGASAAKTSTLPAIESKVSVLGYALADRKQKSSSGFFNRCIENLLQRGRETAAHGMSPGETEKSDQRSQSGDLSSTDAMSSLKLTSTSSRSHRKSRKPTKISHLRLSEDVVIASAVTPLPFCCESCSTYTCNSSSELSVHSAVCNRDLGVPEKSSGFICTYCKADFLSVEDLRDHLSQHTGDHTFHCFCCSYCDHHSNSMDNMDQHVTVQHPTEVARYQVSLEKVSYLQNMLECPVCGGAFLWKSSFVQHCRSEHNLQGLAAHLESTFPESPSLKNCKVSRQLFESFGDILQTDSFVEDATNVEMNQLNSETSQYCAVTAKRFKCDQCSFSADNWELWDRHVREHHEQSVDNFLQGDDEDWPNSAPLVIDEEEDLSVSAPPDSQLSKMFSTTTSCPQSINKTTVNAESNLQHSSASAPDAKKVRNEDGTGMFPPGMEPELIAVNPGSGEVPQLTKIGSGRKGVKLRCRLCPFECYRTPNFKRHLAIHVHQAEYPESYRCAYCKFQHRRLNCIRFHLGKYHGQLPAKLSRVVGGKIVEVIHADDVSLHSSKYGRCLPVSSSNSMRMPGATCTSGSLPVRSEDHVVNKRDELSTTSNVISLDDHSQPGSASSREKRLCKPPKRLSDSSDFQPPGINISNWRMRRVASGSLEDGNAAHLPRLTGQSRSSASRPFDENIAEDYMQSDLPPGMIYQEPIKCPRCSFRNRVRINLVRHMKQHHTEDEQQRNSSRTPSVSSASAVPTSELFWMDWVNPQSASQSSSQTSPDIQSVVNNAPTKTLRNNVVSGSSLFRKFSNFLPKPAPKLPHRLESLSGAEGKFTHGYMTSGRLEWNVQDPGRPRAAHTEDKSLSSGGVIRTGGSSRMFGGLATKEAPVKRLFKCAYCAVSSRWNRRDISLHILHVHIRRRAFRCRRCGYGTSKSAAAVTVHCARTHPGRPAIIEDNLTILNAILPLHSRPGVVSVAFRRPNGVPIMSVDELEEYFGLSKISTTGSAEDQIRQESAQLSESFSQEDPILQEYSGSAPLDLSAQLQKDSIGGVSHQSVFPLPYDSDVLSRDGGQSPHLTGMLSSPRRQSDGSEKLLQQPPDSATSVELNRGEVAAGIKDTRPTDTAAVSRRNSGSSPKETTSQFSTTPATAAFYRCKLCGYQDSRHDKTKYHVVREHLHLGPYGCAYCPRYMWGRRHVARHIAAAHPSMPVQIRRAFDEFETYLRENIRKIGGMPSRFPSASVRKSWQSPLGSSVTPTSFSSLHPDTSAVIESLLQQPSASAAQTLEPLVVKRKPTFQCAHCEYRDALAARVQGHCLAKHPSKPVRYRRLDDEEDDASESAATGALADVKIESVESLAFGQDFFQTPDAPRSTPSDIGTHSAEHPSYQRPHDSGRSAPTGERRGSLLGDGAGGRRDTESETAGELVEFPPFICRYCPQKAWTEALIRSHLASAHADKPAHFGVVQHCISAPYVSLPSARDAGAVVHDDDDDGDDDDDEGTDSGMRTLFADFVISPFFLLSQPLIYAFLYLVSWLVILLLGYLAYLY